MDNDTNELLKKKANQLKEITVNSNTGNSVTVNRKDKSLDTVNSRDPLIEIDPVELDKFLEKYSLHKEAVAQALANKIEDQKSLPYYRLLVQNNQPKALLEILSYVLEMHQRGKIRTTKAIFFIAILRRRKMKYKFKSS